MRHDHCVPAGPAALGSQFGQPEPCKGRMQVKLRFVHHEE